MMMKIQNKSQKLRRRPTSSLSSSWTSSSSSLPSSLLLKVLILWIVSSFVNNIIYNNGYFFPTILPDTFVATTFVVQAFMVSKMCPPPPTTTSFFGRLDDQTKSRRRRLSSSSSSLQTHQRKQQQQQQELSSSLLLLFSTNVENDIDDSDPTPPQDIISSFRSNHQDLQENDDDGDDSKQQQQQPQQHLLRPLLQLASMHCTSQALRAFVELNIPDIMLSSSSSSSSSSMSLHEITSAIGPTTNHDALLRCLRLLSTVNIVKEQQIQRDNDNDYDQQIYFSLTEMGQLLARNNNSTSGGGMSACIEHWMEQPLWDAWLHLPSYIKGEYYEDDKDNNSYEEEEESNDGTSAPASTPSTTTTTTTDKSDPTHSQLTDSQLTPPFDRANDGISSDYYYNEQDHPNSLKLANEFVKFIHQQEIQAIVNLEYWNKLFLTHRNDNDNDNDNNNSSKKLKILDIGGHYGQVMDAINEQYPNKFDLYSLDLPHVITSYEANPSKQQTQQHTQVTLIPGNVFDSTTIPNDCDVIFMKHFLDRCMWTDDETIQIMNICASKATKAVVIAEAVIPNVGDDSCSNMEASSSSSVVELSMDALYMLVGRERQRTESDWQYLAKQSGLSIKEMIKTHIPSCSILIMEKETSQPS